MFKIGEFSKLTMISIRMLRHYDEIGLLVPQQVDRFTSYRYYAAEQLAAAGKIQFLRTMGFGLAAIAEILAKYGDADQLKRYLNTHLIQLQEEARKLDDRLALLQATIERLGKDDTVMNYTVTLKEIPQMQVMSLRDIIPAYTDEGDLWKRMYGEVAGQNVQFASPAYSIAAFYDEGHKDSDVDIEVRSAVSGNYRDTEHVQFKAVPAVTVASAFIKGGFEGTCDCCAAIGAWIESNRYQMNGPMFNIYHVSPGMDPNPENWVVEICFPVCKR